MSETNTKILTKKQKGQNRHWKNFLDKDYLGSHNLEKGEEMQMTIVKFEGEEKIKTQEGEKLARVLYFKEDIPKMIINITNGNTLAHLYGPHPEQWIGKTIQVHATPIKAFGKTQDALRIRDFVPKRHVDTKKYQTKLKKAKDLKELKSIWVKLPASARDEEELITFKNDLKKKLK